MLVINEIGIPATLEQLAEEASELSHAALKLSRLYRGENPTPKTERECIEALMEEIADTELCITELIPGNIINLYRIDEIKAAKLTRWLKRIMESKNE